MHFLKLALGAALPLVAQAHVHIDNSVGHDSVKHVKRRAIGIHDGQLQARQATGADNAEAVTTAMSVVIVDVYPTISTSTILSTSTVTVHQCPASVIDCPARSHTIAYVTSVVPVSISLCPTTYVSYSYSEVPTTYGPSEAPSSSSLSTVIVTHAPGPTISYVPRAPQSPSPTPPAYGESSVLPSSSPSEATSLSPSVSAPEYASSSAPGPSSLPSYGSTSTPPTYSDSTSSSLVAPSYGASSVSGSAAQSSGVTASSVLAPPSYGVSSAPLTSSSVPVVSVPSSQASPSYYLSSPSSSVMPSPSLSLTTIGAVPSSYGPGQSSLTAPLPSYGLASSSASPAPQSNATSGIPQFTSSVVASSLSVVTTVPQLPSYGANATAATSLATTSALLPSSYGSNSSTELLTTYVGTLTFTSGQATSWLPQYTTPAVPSAPVYPSDNVSSVIPLPVPSSNGSYTSAVLTVQTSTLLSSRPVATFPSYNGSVVAPPPAYPSSILPPPYGVTPSVSHTQETGPGYPSVVSSGATIPVIRTTVVSTGPAGSPYTSVFTEVPPAPTSIGPIVYTSVISNGPGGTPVTSVFTATGGSAGPSSLAVSTPVSAVYTTVAQPGPGGIPYTSVYTSRPDQPPAYQTTSAVAGTGANPSGPAPTPGSGAPPVYGGSSAIVYTSVATYESNGQLYTTIATLTSEVAPSYPSSAIETPSQLPVVTPSATRPPASGYTVVVGHGPSTYMTTVIPYGSASAPATSPLSYTIIVPGSTATITTAVPAYSVSSAVTETYPASGYTTIVYPGYGSSASITTVIPVTGYTTSAQAPASSPVYALPTGVSPPGPGYTATVIIPGSTTIAIAPATGTANAGPVGNGTATTSTVPASYTGQAGKHAAATLTMMLGLALVFLAA